MSAPTNVQGLRRARRRLRVVGVLTATLTTLAAPWIVVSHATSSPTSEAVVVPPEHQVTHQPFTVQGPHGTFTVTPRSAE